jgi:hypothetical protein
VKLAQILARAGLHLGSTTIRRMQRDTQWPEPRKAVQPAPRIVTARKPNHLWHVDLRPCPLHSASGSLGFPSPCPKSGHFAGGLRLPSTTSLDG